MKSTDIRIDAVAINYEEFRYRTPIKFGGVASDRVTVLNVLCPVYTRNGQRACGFGSMPLGNVWSFPSRTLGYDQTLAAMKALVERIAAITRRCSEFGHPIDLTWQLEPEYVRAAETVTASLELAETIPTLCMLVCASPFDAALHDAFGKVHGLNCYHTYSPEFMNHDLGHYLGSDFRGETLDRYLRKEPEPRMPLYHLIGALDPLEEKDLVNRIGDTLPETLPEWIEHDGLTHLKIKLNGDDLAWDVNRVLNVDRVAAAVQRHRGVARWYYSLDFNEKCASVDYLLDFLRQVREAAPEGFERIQYIEQPTARDLKANRQNVMHEASKIRPVVIDESLIDLESLRIARDMGYTGAALKACKGQSQSLILAAAAQKLGMFLCVQDLTCPGASLIHSAGLAAHIPGVAAIESNARQYCPAANVPWEARFPGIFRVTEGTIATGTLVGPGLSALYV
jgi:L-alanine-DL-glutamate epimerase-like enolase superfamily enzyme